MRLFEAEEARRLAAMTPENERRKLFVSVLECKELKRMDGYFGSNDVFVEVAVDEPVPEPEAVRKKKLKKSKSKIKLAKKEPPKRQITEIQKTDILYSAGVAPKWADGAGCGLLFENVEKGDVRLKLGTGKNAFHWAHFYVVKSNHLPRQARDRHKEGKLKTEKTVTAFCARFFCAGVFDWDQTINEEIGRYFRKHAFFGATFTYKTIFLPRQARDTHRETLKTLKTNWAENERCVFCSCEVSDLPDLEDEDWAVCAWHPVYDKPKLLKSGAENAFFGCRFYI